MKKEKIVLLQCVDCSFEETKLLAKELRALDVPYNFIISNREIKVLTKDEVKEFIKVLLEVTKK